MGLHPLLGVPHSDPPSIAPFWLSMALPMGTGCRVGAEDGVWLCPPPPMPCWNTWGRPPVECPEPALPPTLLHPWVHAQLGVGGVVAGHRVPPAVGQPHSFGGGPGVH